MSNGSNQPPPSVLALDIGGANIKAAHSGGPALLCRFELWKNPTHLSDVLRDLFQELPPFDVLAVTMTGELCDCYATKRQGVEAILDAVAAAVPTGRVLVWQTDGRLAEVAAARREPLRAAAANWLALAEFSGRYLPRGAGLLVDVGSTTADIVPLWNGRPVPQGRTDFQRLRSRELVYTGVRRTPVCALLGGEGAAELFATTLDVYLVLGPLAEDAVDRGTADGRPATRPAAYARLARMLGADLETCNEEDVWKLAQRINDRQRVLLGRALTEVSARMPEAPRAAITAGSGEFLARQALSTVHALKPLPVISLAAQLGPPVSEAACAYALMVLARERSHEL